MYGAKQNWLANVLFYNRSLSEVDYDFKTYVIIVRWFISFSLKSSNHMQNIEKLVINKNTTCVNSSSQYIQHYCFN